MTTPYILSAIKQNVFFIKHLTMDKIQEISIKKYDPYYRPKDSIGERVDTSVYFYDHIDVHSPEWKAAYDNIVCIEINHLHKQSRKDNYTINIHTKE